MTTSSLVINLVASYTLVVNLVASYTLVVNLVASYILVVNLVALYTLVVNLVVTCWERADLLALVCGVCCEFVTFPLVSWVRCGT